MRVRMENSLPISDHPYTDDFRRRAIPAPIDRVDPEHVAGRLVHKSEHATWYSHLALIHPPQHLLFVERCEFLRATADVGNGKEAQQDERHRSGVAGHVLLAGRNEHDIAGLDRELA